MERYMPVFLSLCTLGELQQDKLWMNVGPLSSSFHRFWSTPVTDFMDVHSNLHRWCRFSMSMISSIALLIGAYDPQIWLAKKFSSNDKELCSLCVCGGNLKYQRSFYLPQIF